MPNLDLLLKSSREQLSKAVGALAEEELASQFERRGVARRMLKEAREALQREFDDTRTQLEAIAAALGRVSLYLNKYGKEQAVPTAEQAPYDGLSVGQKLAAIKYQEETQQEILAALKDSADNEKERSRLEEEAQDAEDKLKEEKRGAIYALLGPLGPFAKVFNDLRDEYAESFDIFGKHGQSHELEQAEQQDDHEKWQRDQSAKTDELGEETAKALKAVDKRLDYLEEHVQALENNAGGGAGGLGLPDADLPDRNKPAGGKGRPKPRGGVGGLARKAAVLGRRKLRLASRWGREKLEAAKGLLGTTYGAGSAKSAPGKPWVVEKGKALLAKGADSAKGVWGKVKGVAEAAKEKAVAALGAKGAAVAKLGGRVLGAIAAPLAAYNLATISKANPTDTATDKALAYGGAALDGATIGATVGSVVPVVGTVAGAAVGAVAGAAIAGVKRNWADIKAWTADTLGYVEKTHEKAAENLTETAEGVGGKLASLWEAGKSLLNSGAARVASASTASTAAITGTPAHAPAASTPKAAISAPYSGSASLLGGSTPQAASADTQAGVILASEFSKTLGKHEGGYSSVNLGATGKYRASSRGLASMTVDDVIAAQEKGEFSAAGKYQIINTTLKAAKEKLGLKGDEKFDAATQDRIFAEYLIKTKRKDLWAYLNGDSNDLDAAALAASKEWASLAAPQGTKVRGKTLDGETSYYAGVANNKAKVDADEVKAQLTQLRNQMDAHKKRQGEFSTVEATTPVPVTVSSAYQTTLGSRSNRSDLAPVQTDAYAQPREYAAKEASVVFSDQSPYKRASAVTPGADVTVEPATPSSAQQASRTAGYSRAYGAGQTTIKDVPLVLGDNHMIVFNTGMV